MPVKNNENLLTYVKVTANDKVNSFEIQYSISSNHNQWLLLGYSALHMAAAWNRVESLKVLVDSGADCDLKNSYNELARDVAARYGNRNCMNYLDSAG